MKISIVIVVLNDKDLIKRTLGSAIKQDYIQKEIIVIDGSSTDGTLEVINEYENEIAVIVSEKDNGIYDAMNKAIDYVTGDFVSYLNSGDMYDDDHVLTKVFYGRDSASFDIIIGDTYVYDDNGYCALIKPEKNIVKELPNKVPACHQSTFVKTGALKKNPFNVTYTLAADVNFLVISFMANKSIKYLDFPVSRYLLGGITAKRINFGAIELIKIMYDCGLGEHEIFGGVIYRKLVERSLETNSMAKKFILNYLLAK